MSALTEWLRQRKPNDGSGSGSGTFGHLGNIIQENANPFGIFGESDGDRAERLAGFDESRDSLDALRNRIPGSRRTQEQILADPAFQEEWAKVFGDFPAMAALLERYTNMPPTAEEQRIEYGTVDPESLNYVSDDLTGYEASLMDGTAFDDLQGIEEREGYAGTQQDAMDRVLGIANEEGLTAIDRARIAEQRAGEEQWLRGQRGATLANMEARGLGGSGAELASIFDSQQSSANRNAMSGVQFEALAQQRQDQALRDAFGMSSDARNQSFGEASYIASAQDRTNQWNSQLGTDQARYLSDVMNQGVYTDSGIRNANVYDTRDQGDRGQDATREAERWRFGQDAWITGGQNDIAIGEAASNTAATQRTNDAFDRVLRGVATSGASEGFRPGAGVAPGSGTKFMSYQPPPRSDIIDPWRDDEDD